ncbi:MAG: ATP-binding protein [Metamycoplasmataceae bacterium]
MKIISNELLSKYEAKIFFNKNIYQREIFDELFLTLEKHNLLLIGLRQVGKTTLLEQLGKKYWQTYLDNSRKEDKTISFQSNNLKIFYINIKALTQFDNLNQALINEISSNKYKLILIDEIQSLPNWSNFVQALIDLNPQARFIFSGSNASALKQETMVNRIKIYYINPLSFLEFKMIWNLDQIETYLKYGSYPKSFQYEDPLLQYRELVETIIIDKIINEDADKKIDAAKFKLLMKKILNFIGNELVISKLEDVKITRQTATNYIKIMAECQLIHLVPKYLDKNEKNKSKIYFEDKSMMYFLNNFQELDSNSYGALIENIIHFYLNRKYSNTMKLPNIFYYRGENGKEIDFLLENEKILVECKYQKNLDGEAITKTLNETIAHNFTNYRKIVITLNINQNINGWELISFENILRGKNEL